MPQIVPKRVGVHPEPHVRPLGAHHAATSVAKLANGVLVVLAVVHGHVGDHLLHQHRLLNNNNNRLLHHNHLLVHHWLVHHVDGRGQVDGRQGQVDGRVLGVVVGNALQLAPCRQQGKAATSRRAHGAAA